MASEAATSGRVLEYEVDIWNLNYIAKIAEIG